MVRNEHLHHKAGSWFCKAGKADYISVARQLTNWWGPNKISKLPFLSIATFDGTGFAITIIGTVVLKDRQPTLAPDNVCT